MEEFFAVNLRWLSGALFVVAMLEVICGLACFLREVYLATHTTSIDPARFAESIEQIASVYAFKTKPKPEDIFDASYLPPFGERRPHPPAPDHGPP